MPDYDDMLLLRIAEALVFASAGPVSVKALEERLPEGADIAVIMQQLAAHYETRGVQLVKRGEAYAFRTAPDLVFLFAREEENKRRLSRAAQEVLAIIAYHQPVTRAELEDIRGVETAKGTLDLLLETGWVKIRGRRRMPGRPVTYGTTQDFLDHFNLSDIGDLPGMEELKGAGLLSARIPAHFSIAPPAVRADELSDEEEPIGVDDLEDLGLFAPRGEEA